MTNLDNWPKRLYSLDIARGFASIAVILWHLQHFSYTGTQRSTDFEKETQPFFTCLKIFYQQGARGVEFFFLLSGFVFFWLYHDSIKNGTTTPREFIIARFSRLYPLHFVTLLLVACLQGIFWARTHHYFVYPYNDVYHFILHLFLANHWGLQQGWSFNAPVWSVSIEVLLYVVFFLISMKRLGNIYFCVMVCLLSFVGLHFFHYAIFTGLTSFFLGAAIFHTTYLFLLKSPVLKRIIYGVCITSWTVVIVNHYFYDLEVPLAGWGVGGKLVVAIFPVFVLFSSTVCSIALMEISAHVRRSELKFLKSISWIGDISYSSYLLHFPLQAIFGLAVTFDLLEKNFFLRPFWFIVFFVILISISYLSCFKFERKIQIAIRDRFLNYDSKVYE